MDDRRIRRLEKNRESGPSENNERIVRRRPIQDPEVLVDEDDIPEKDSTSSGSSSSEDGSEDNSSSDNSEDSEKEGEDDDKIPFFAKIQYKLKVVI